VSFVNCCEYTRDPEVSRARQLFFQGEVQYLLVTERFQFFKRYRLRGAQHCIFYSLPEHGDFYHETINLLQPMGGGILTSGGASSAAWSENMCVVLYTRYDALNLSRVVGEERARRLVMNATAARGGEQSEQGLATDHGAALESDRGTFMFISNAGDARAAAATTTPTFS